jgi:hypothetical protein
MAVLCTEVQWIVDRLYRRPVGCRRERRRRHQAIAHECADHAKVQGDDQRQDDAATLVEGIVLTLHTVASRKMDAAVKWLRGG